MSINELDRTAVCLKLEQRVLNQEQAAEILGITTRQIRRLFKNYKKQGAIALVSKKRGQASNHQSPVGLKELAAALIKDRYPDFGPTLAHEKLIEVHKLKISVWLVRELMIAHGLWSGKKLKKSRAYPLRERRSSEGELIQMDGSPHDWFEGRGPKCSLLLCVDDATSKIKAAWFAPAETFWGYCDLIGVYVKKHGRPIGCYNDKHAVFRVNQEGALRSEGITQFGRVMKELDIKMIYANSPQAKGRIERSNRTLQDRLVKELRLNKISTIEEANAYLPVFIEDYNRRFATTPANPTNAHRVLREDQNLDLIFTIQEFRQLTKNLTFQYKNILYQVQTERSNYTLSRGKVTIREKRDGSIDVFYKGKPLQYRIYGQQEMQGEVVDSKRLNDFMDQLQKNQIPPKPKYRPSLKHPWKRDARRKLFGKLAEA